MAAATERIPVLVTGPEKLKISKAAKAAGLSVGAYLRHAASSFQPGEDVQALDGLIEQVRKSTASANAALDRALVAIAASNARIEGLERSARLQKTVV